jgi:hypothetical protein
MIRIQPGLPKTLPKPDVSRNFRSSNYFPNRSGAFSIHADSRTPIVQSFCRQEEYSGHWLILSSAQAVDLSV